MRKRRREEERGPGHPGKRQLARLDAATRAGVLEQLQQAGGNKAVQDVVAGAQLQRDTATSTQAVKPSTSQAGTAHWVLALDGTVVGSVRSVDGLSVRSEVVTEVGSGQGHKHVGSTRVEPGVLEVGLGMSAGFYEWIGAALNRKHERKDLTLHHVDSGGHERAALDLKHVLVTAVEVPQLVAADTSPAWLKVTIACDDVRRVAGSGTKVDAKPASDPLNPSTMRFDVSGIGRVSELKSLAPWTFKLGTKVYNRGQSNDLEPTTPDFGNLVVTLAEAANAGFDAWFDDALVKGNTLDESERTAVLTVSSKGGRRLELSFSGVGIFSADQIAKSGAGGRRYGLYVEGAKLRVS